MFVETFFALRKKNKQNVRKINYMIIKRAHRRAYVRKADWFWTKNVQSACSHAPISLKKETRLCPGEAEQAVTRSVNQKRKKKTKKKFDWKKINSRDKKHIKSPKVFCATERFQDCNIKQTNLNFKNKTALNMLTVPTAAMRLSSIPYLFQHLHTEP